MHIPEMKYAVLFALALVGACQVPARPLDWDQPGALPLFGIHAEPHIVLEALVEQHGTEYLAVTLTALNPGSAAARFERGHCVLRVRAYSSADLTEPAFWDDHSGDSNTACYAELLEYLIPPGRTRIVADTLLAGDLAMGLPDRPGHFGVIVDRDGQRVVLPAGSSAQR